VSRSCKYSRTLPATILRSPRKLGVVVAAALACAAGASSVASTSAAAAPGASCPGAGLVPDGVNDAAVDAATLCLVNRVRVAHHLHGLRANGELASVASSQVGSMLRSNYFSDVRPSGQTPMSLVAHKRYGARAISVGQNLAWGTGGFSTPASIVAAWMESPPHRKIMLTPLYHDAGAGVRPSTPSVIGVGRSGATYAILFGARLP
jgi:uncharacterized protein YkwD